MWRTSKALVSAAGFITLLSFPAFSLAQAPRPTLAIIGVSSEVRGKVWEDARIGLGISQLLSQILFESGRFRLLEEKEEVRAELESLRARQWAAEAPDEQKAVGIARRLRADLVAYGRVLSARSTRSQAFAGPFVSGRQTTTVTVEVRLTSARGGPSLSAQGQGESSVGAAAVGFQIQKDKILFDETTVGRATKEAMKDAVKKLLSEYRGP